MRNAGLCSLAAIAILHSAVVSQAQTWSTPQLLNDPVYANTDIKEAHIVAAANGFHAVYRVTGNSRIQYRRYYNGSLKPAQDVFPASNFAANGNIGLALDGTVHVVLEDWASGGPEIRWYKFNVDDNTGAISNKVNQVLSASGGTAKHPHISPYGLSGGQMLMSYYRSGSTGGGSKKIYYAPYNGTSWAAEANSGSSCNSEYECFGQSRAPDGSVWRSFTDAGNLKIRRYNGSWASEISLDNNGQMHNRQRLSVNDSGQIMVVWDESDALWSMLYTVGVGPGPKTQISNQNSWYQGACAIPGSNNFQVGYPKNDPYPARCYSKKWANNTWQVEEMVSTGMPNGDAFTVQPELSGSLDNSGLVYCIFEYWGNNKPQQYFSIKPGTPPGPTGTLTGHVYDQYGTPLNGASVTVAPQNATITDVNGLYSFQIPVGTSSASASKAFYIGQTLTGFTIIQNQSTTLDFHLSGQPPANVSNFTAAASNVNVDLHWTNPGDATYSGTLILYKIGSAPAGPADPTATILVDDAAPIGSTRSFSHTNALNGKQYYYAAYSYFQDAHRFYASGVGINATPALQCDFNRDGDVDQSDFGQLQICLTGANVPISNPACLWADLDSTPDNDVDSADLNLLLGCSFGADVYASPNCLP